MKKSLGHLFITSSSSRFFNKTDFEQYLFTDPSPRGAHRGRAPQMTACGPPNENCAPQNLFLPPQSRYPGAGPVS